MKTVQTYATLFLGCLLVAGCTQTTPSMMNTSPIELRSETHMEQIPLEHIDDLSMSILAQQYTRYGDGPLELTMTYDPKSKSYTAMKALHTLKGVEEKLATKGLANVKMDTLAVEGQKPALMVMYPSVQAQAPSDCGAMPGLNDNITGRELLAPYKFGCGVETMMARQVYRPADLRGRGGEVMGVNDGRRISNVMTTYHTLNERQATGDLVETLERENIQSE